MDQYLMFNKEGRFSPPHAVLGGVDGIHEFIPDEYKTFIVHVGKGWYHEIKTHGGVSFEVEVKFKVEV